MIEYRDWVTGKETDLFAGIKYKVKTPRRVKMIEFIEEKFNDGGLEVKFWGTEKLRTVYIKLGGKL